MNPKIKMMMSCSIRLCVQRIQIPLVLFFIWGCETNYTIDDTITDTHTGEPSTNQVGCANLQTDSDILVCNDFETGIAAQTELLHGTVLVEKENVFSGTQSMRAHTEEQNSWATLVYPFPPMNSGTIYFRTHIFIAENSILGTTKLINLSGNSSDEDEQTYGVDINFSSQKSLDIYLHGNFTRYESEPNMIPEGQWFCLTGRYSISAISGETSVWINNNLVVSTTASQDSVITGGVSEFRLGIGWTENGQDTATLLLDELLVATVPVNCFQD